MNEEHLIAILDKWPDFLEVYQEGDDETKQRVVCVLTRRNSRSIQSDQMRLLQTLELVGLTVRVRVGTVDLTIEQFEKGGVYRARPTQSVEGTQSFYNAQSKLNKLEALLTQIDKDDPRYEVVVRRVQHLKTMLSTGEPEVPKSRVEMSNAAYKEVMTLLSLPEMPTTPLGKAPSQCSDEELLKTYPHSSDMLPFYTPASPEWLAMSDRWAILKRKQKETSERGEE